MEEYAFSSLINAEDLLEEMCKNVDLCDIPVTQKIIDFYFGQIAGEMEDMEQEFLDLAFAVTDFFDRPSEVRAFAIFLQAGPQIRCEDYVLRFPKIIARY